MEETSNTEHGLSPKASPHTGVMVEELSLIPYGDDCFEDDPLALTYQAPSSSTLQEDSQAAGSSHLLVLSQEIAQGKSLEGEHVSKRLRLNSEGNYRNEEVDSRCFPLFTEDDVKSFSQNERGLGRGGEEQLLELCCAKAHPDIVTSGSALPEAKAGGTAQELHAAIGPKESVHPAAVSMGHKMQTPSGPETWSAYAAFNERCHLQRFKDRQVGVDSSLAQGAHLAPTLAIASACGVRDDEPDVVILESMSSKAPTPARLMPLQGGWAHPAQQAQVMKSFSENQAAQRLLSPQVFSRSKAIDKGQAQLPPGFRFSHPQPHQAMSSRAQVVTSDPQTRHDVTLSGHKRAPRFPGPCSNFSPNLGVPRSGASLFQVIDSSAELQESWNELCKQLGVEATPARASSGGLPQHTGVCHPNQGSARSPPVRRTGFVHLDSSPSKMSSMDGTGSEPTPLALPPPPGGEARAGSKADGPGAGIAGSLEIVPALPQPPPGDVSLSKALVQHGGQEIMSGEEVLSLPGLEQQIQRTEFTIRAYETVLRVLEERKAGCVVFSKELEQELATLPEAVRARVMSDAPTNAPCNIAGSIIRELGLAVNQGNQKIIGAVPGVKVGQRFRYRQALALVGLHMVIEGGIDFFTRGSDGSTIATSVVMSGGYEDDEDEGESFDYTGQGGRKQGSKYQNEDQKLERGNLGLVGSHELGLPVRVVRKNNSETGGYVYVYDGLYKVAHWRKAKGLSGFYVFKFRLERLPGQAPLSSKPVAAKKWKAPPAVAMGPEGKEGNVLEGPVEEKLQMVLFEGPKRPLPQLTDKGQGSKEMISFDDMSKSARTLGLVPALEQGGAPRRPAPRSGTGPQWQGPLALPSAPGPMGFWGQYPQPLAPYQMHSPGPFPPPMRACNSIPRMSFPQDHIGGLPHMGPPLIRVGQPQGLGGTNRAHGGPFFRPAQGSPSFALQQLGLGLMPYVRTGSVPVQHSPTFPRNAGPHPQREGVSLLRFPPGILRY